ncbi:MAG TPA: TIGR03667 family PPOX class F420-dependent oxidoreductase [Ktedonobacteraceae bacterium]|nr:TIGR03667 family PPOX class F420-dependent oxidoreductase [Ktedonobacteraceae bacterium]
MAFQIPATSFGERVARRLHNDPIIWLTMVDGKGTPQPNPVWFLWDEATSTILIYSKDGAKRHEHLQKNSRVSLNFDGNGQGGDIIVLSGEVRLSPEDPPADQYPAFVAKYQSFIDGGFGTAQNFARLYPVALRVQPTGLRGH